MSRRTSPRSRHPCRHWKMAECSESTGTISAPFSFARAITSSPAHTKVSLLARAMRLPQSMAARVGFSPATPTMAVTTVSALGRAAASSSPSGPDRTCTSVSASRTRRSAAAFSSTTATSCGLNFRAWASASSTLRFTVMAATLWPQVSATFSVC